VEGCGSWVVGWLGLRHAEIAVGHGEIRSWPWRPAERRRTRPIGGKAMFPTVTNRLRVGSSGRDISVDSLATELVIDGSLTHGATP
jgi:hypothetical protein